MVKSANKVGLQLDRLDELNFSSWMTNLPDFLRVKPLIYLAIPGSHNSFSYSISSSKGVSPDSPKIVQQLSRFFKIIVNPIIYKWSKTQSLDIKQQLSLGIRYLDLRLVCKNGDFFLAHGLYGGLLFPFLLDVSDFLNSHPGEIVILDFQHFYEFTQQDHETLISNLRQKLGNKMCLRQNIENISINYLTGIGQQIMAVYRNVVAKDYPELWPSGVLPTPWPNKIDATELLEFLDEGIKTRNGELGLVSQCLLTVDTCYILKHPLGNLRKLAAKTNSSIMPWIDEQSPGSKGVNVIICDFVEGSDFVKTVIDLNYEKDLGGGIKSV